MILPESQEAPAGGSPSRRRWQRYSPMLAMTAWLLCATSVACGGDVLAVLSTDAAPYRQAFMSLRDYLTADGREHQVSFVLLEDLIEDEEKYLTDKMDATVGIGTKAAVWLHRNVDESVAVIYCMVASPGDVGLNSGRAAAGVTTHIPFSEQFEFISRVLPKARTVGMIYNAESRKSKLLHERLSQALPRTWKLRAVAKDEDKSIAETIEDLFNSRVDLVWTAPDSSVYDIPTVRTLLLAAMRHKTPVFGFSPQFVRAGALFGVGVSPKEQGKQVAELVQRKLTYREDSAAGRNGNTPVAPVYETAVNLIVAEKLGVDLPRKVVREAEHVWPEKEGEKD